MHEMFVYFCVHSQRSNYSGSRNLFCPHLRNENNKLKDVPFLIQLNILKENNEKLQTEKEKLQAEKEKLQSNIKKLQNEKSECDDANARLHISIEQLNQW